MIHVEHQVASVFARLAFGKAMQTAYEIIVKNMNCIEGQAL